MKVKVKNTKSYQRVFETIVKKEKEMEKIKAYKITDKNGQCRGYQYEVGKIYEMGGTIELCGSGFHACIEPMGCMSYRDIYEARFFEVLCDGNIERGNDKVVCSKIEIVKELTLKEYLNVCFISISLQCKDEDSGDYAKLASSGNSAKLASSGDYAQLASSGDYAKLASLGDYAQLASSGDYAKLASLGNSAKLASSGNFAQLASSGDSAQLASSGDYAQLASSGDSAQLASSGDYAQLASSGDYAKLASLGNSAKLASSGNSAVVAGIGYNNRVMISCKDSWIVLADWRDDKPCRVVAKRPGQKVDGITIKTNYWYWFEDGRLKEEKGDES